MVGFSHHESDQLLQVLVRGEQGGTIVVGAHPEDEPRTVGVQQPHAAQGCGHLVGDHDLADGAGDAEASPTQVVRRVLPGTTGTPRRARMSEDPADTTH